MKTNKILNGAVALLVSASMVSCSSDYLDIAPVTSFATNTITSSEEGVETAYYGLCSAMYCQYGAYQNYYSFNGEPWLAAYYGDVAGSDYFSWIWGGRTNTFALNWTAMTNAQSWIPLMGWFYGYTLVSGANEIIGGFDVPSDPNASLDGISTNIAYYLAGAYAIRAHAYTRLLQIYAPRWEDSNNGQTKCIIIRKPGTVGDTPLVTMNEVLDLIYSDLNTSLRLYSYVGSKAVRSYNWEPNTAVAQGIYARAAMLKHDYVTAEKMAHDARQKFPIMTAKEYKSGFAEANAEWMWNNDKSPEGIYYYAWGSWYACNGPYPTIWGFGPGAMNYDLGKQFQDGDIRSDLYIIPNGGLAKTIMASCNISRADFWDAKIDPDCIDLASLKGQKYINFISKMNHESIPNGEYAKWILPNEPPKGEADAKGSVVVPFGAQYKFWCLDNFGSSSFPFMRGAEMLLTEAEAAYHNNHTSVCTGNLTELMAKRNPKYAMPATSGQGLLDEIKLQRRLELWGEGHSWFDLKRWNEPMVRRAWVAKDVTSGNIPVKYAITMEPSANHGWRYAIPQSETQYNQAIKVADLGY